MIECVFLIIIWSEENGRIATGTGNCDVIQSKIVEEIIKMVRKNETIEQNHYRKL